MKLKLSFFSAILSVLIFAQSAPSYYNGIDFSKSGDAIKLELVELITTTHSYNTTYTDLKSLYKTSDVDPENPENILLIYGSENSGIHQRSMDHDNFISGNTGWNREHVYPKSLGTPKLTNSGPGADGHHIRPSEGNLNSLRSNLKFVDGTGAKAGRLSGGFYPGEEWKGDVARILMYMYLRYDDRTKPNNVVNSPSTYSSDFPDVLIKWNIEDPVSDFERNRNEVVYQVQKNRNPFIDNPYLATLIWGGPEAENTWPNTINGGGIGDDVAPSQPQNLTLIYVESNQAKVSWDASTDNVSVSGYNVYLDGTFYKKVNDTNITITGLSPKTTYKVTVEALDSSNNKSVLSNILEFTTKEGGSNTGTSCGEEDFENIGNKSSGYETREWTNNGITWSATEARTDQDLDGRAIVTKKGEISSSSISGGIGSLTVTTQRVFSGGEGLFKLYINGEEKGEIPYSEKEETITINNINVEGDFTIEIRYISGSGSKDRVAFDNLSWTCYSNLAVDNLTISNENVVVYPNPVKNQIIYFKGLNSKQDIEIYNVAGQLMQVIKNVENNKRINLNHFAKGIYFIKTESKSIKIIVE